MTAIAYIGIGAAVLIALNLFVFCLCVIAGRDDEWAGRK